MAAEEQALFSLSDVLPQEEVVDLTRRLVEFHSTPNNQEELGACLAFLAAWCAQAGLHVQIHDTRPECGLYVGPSTRRAPLLLLSHFDVAAGPDTLFSSLVCGDQLYGRGALDDKYAVALSLVLYREACRAAERGGGTQEDVPLMLLLTGTGEEGALLGTQPILETLHPDFCISLDGGDPRHIVTREKGGLRLELETYGEASDGARPWRGKNALDALIADYLVLSSVLQRKRKDNDPTYWYPTLNLDQIRAGTSFNAVPDSARAQMDIRFTEHEDPKILYDELQRAISGSLSILYEEPVFEALPSPWRNLLFRLTGATEGKGHGGSSAHCFSRRGVSGVVWGADGDGSQHSTSEHLNISSMQPVYQGLARLVSTAFAYMRESFS